MPHSEEIQVPKKPDFIEIKSPVLLAKSQCLALKYAVPLYAQTQFSMFKTSFICTGWNSHHGL